MAFYPPGHENPGVAAVIALLDNWLQAMEGNTAHLRQPDPNYVRPNGEPVWTEEELDTLIRDIDAEIDQEVTRAPGTSVGAKAGPAFYRLLLPQRLALAQQLESAMWEQKQAVIAISDTSGGGEEVSVSLPSGGAVKGRVGYLQVFDCWIVRVYVAGTLHVYEGPTREEAVAAFEKAYKKVAV